MRVKQLKDVINKNGYEYRLIKRDKGKSMYAQYLNNVICAYEIFRTRLTKPHPKSENDCAMYDKVEVFPSDEDFGVRAWTYKDLEKAKSQYETLLT